jgi:hypothetical protein
MQEIEQPVIVDKPKLSHKKLLATVLLLLILAEAFFLLSQNVAVKKAWASIVFDKREHYIDCEHLPFYELAQKAFGQHQDIVNKVKAIPGVVDFFPEENRCKIYEQGTQFVKGQAVLIYKNRPARKQAENIIGKDFFGIPYSGRPVK